MRATDASGLEPAHPLPAAPNVFGNARVSYDLPGAWPTLALAGRWLAMRPADRAFDNNYQPLPYAPAELDLRATLTGETPFLSGLTYRASADWGSSSVAPYIVGPPSPYVAGCTGAACTLRGPLVPVEGFRVMLGVQYDFGQ